VKGVGEVEWELDWGWEIMAVAGDNVTELFSPAVQEGR